MSTELVNNFYIAGKIVLILGALASVVFMWFLIIRSADLKQIVTEMQESCDAARRSIILGAPKPPKFFSVINSIVSMVK